MPELAEFVGPGLARSHATAMQPGEGDGLKREQRDDRAAVLPHQPGPLAGRGIRSNGVAVGRTRQAGRLDVDGSATAVRGGEPGRAAGRQAPINPGRIGQRGGRAAAVRGRQVGRVRCWPGRACDRAEPSGRAVPTWLVPTQTVLDLTVPGRRPNPRWPAPGRLTALSRRPRPGRTVPSRP